MCVLRVAYSIYTFPADEKGRAAPKPQNGFQSPTANAYLPPKHWYDMPMPSSSCVVPLLGSTCALICVYIAIEVLIAFKVWSTNVSGDQKSTHTHTHMLIIWINMCTLLGHTLGAERIHLLFVVIMCDGGLLMPDFDVYRIRYNNTSMCLPTKQKHWWMCGNSSWECSRRVPSRAVCATGFTYIHMRRALK